MGNYFKIHYNAVKYPIDSEKSRGLRNAQLGAIHAISSFFTLNKKEAAIVIMPTGSGKTAVLMLTPYLIRKQRVLVVTRSKMVCGQIAEDFSELRTLCVANVFNTSIKKPNVFELEHLYTKEYQKDLEQADVIVATPSCALSLSESDWAKENIDLVEVDEAHHTPAKTWQQILVNLSAATHVLFTATPFVELYHVKKMGSSSYNNSVGDVYEVSGQAIKSVTWFTTKGKLLEKFTSRHNSGHCIVKKGGNFKTMIKEIKTSGKVLRGCICIVQPGIKKSKAIPDRIQEVLAATDSYVKKAGKVNRLRIMGSI